jgi:hypothetical protein
MNITGIAHPPERIRERGYLPSSELIYLAKMALKEYGATSLITSLAQGWEQALAKAAVELEIPFSVAIPYPGRDAEWKRDACVFYLDLLARAAEVFRVSDSYSDTAVLEGHYWRVDQSNLVLALWDYDFYGDTFQAMDYALKSGKQVTNLWKDWQHLFSLRRIRPVVSVQQRKIGAQIFEGKALT